MKKSDFYFELPEELIAQVPLKNREESRVLVVDKESGEVKHTVFKNILDNFNEGDTLVLNDTKVIPARLYGYRKDSGTKVEFLLLNNIEKNRWETLVKPGRRAKIGSEFSFEKEKLECTVVDILESGSRIVDFKFNGEFDDILDSIGEMPLPPYITEKLEDKDRYQTIYAEHRGSSAAPTAGLHFTKEILNKLKAKGVNIVYITLHVGLGTFRPVKDENIEDHDMHSEYFELGKDAAKTINETVENNNKVIAVGTTSVRTLESSADEFGKVKENYGNTDIFIYPGYKFKIVDKILTNFHLPESTLIMLVSAMLGTEKTMEIYREAVKEKYRFFSFGDAMFIK